MKLRQEVEESTATAESEAKELSAKLLRPLVDGKSRRLPQTPMTWGPCVGELIGIMNNGRTPLVIYPDQPGSAALPAMTVVDLHGTHIGRRVVLLFEAGDPGKPIVMGVVREAEGWPLAEQPGVVEVDADGERLVISAKGKLVLRCGKASISLTSAGKVLVHGTYISTHATGLNRIKGGSVQIN